MEMLIKSLIGNAIGGTIGMIIVIVFKSKIPLIACFLCTLILTLIGGIVASFYF